MDATDCLAIPSTIPYEGNPKVYSLIGTNGVLFH